MFLRSTAIAYAGILGLLANAAPVHVPRQADAKRVVAHHIVGLTAAFQVADWVNDMTIAKANGIDGFALNVGNDPFTNTQAQNAYTAAAQVGGFQLFFSLDMAAFGPVCNSPDGAALIRGLVSKFAADANQLKVAGKAFVSTFAGESCTFGEADVPSGWRNQFTQHPDLAGKIHFAPSFFIDPATYNTFGGVMDGSFNFNGGWRVDLHTANAAQLLPGVDVNNLTPESEARLQAFLGSFDVDTPQISGLAQVPNSAHTYMTAVAPHFFTHFGPDTFNKNFVFDADEHLFARRWENLIANRDKVDIVQVVTWNDFGESHYVGPIRSNLPGNSADWVTGFDHQGFLALTKHYAAQFKTGAAPAIAQDTLVLWARPHPRDAPVPVGDIGKPTDFELLQDKLWAVVLAKADGSLTLATSAGTTQTFDVKAGVNKFALPLSPGGFMQGTLTRGGAQVLDLKPADYTFNPTPAKLNYNVFVASASA